MNDICESCGFEIIRGDTNICHCCEKAKICDTCISKDIWCPSCVDGFEAQREEE